MHCLGLTHYFKSKYFSDFIAYFNQLFHALEIRCNPFHQLNFHFLLKKLSPLIISMYRTIFLTVQTIIY